MSKIPHSARRSLSRMLYYEADQLGSILGITNASNQIVNRHRFEPWGQWESDYSVSEYSAPAFAGRDWDWEVGLYPMRARYYDPLLGRFLSEDPLGLAGGINPYVHVRHASEISDQRQALARREISCR